MARGFKDAIRSWMMDHVGVRYYDIEPMSIECANSVDCSSVTSRRWIIQLAQKNGPYKLMEDGSGCFIQERR